MGGDNFFSRRLVAVVDEEGDDEDENEDGEEGVGPVNFVTSLVHKLFQLFITFGH